MVRLTSPVADRQKAGSRDYISFSAVNTFQSCSLRYYFRYIRGLPEKTIAASLVLGSAIHSCLQYHYEQMLVGNDPPDLDTLLDVFQDSWHTRAGQKVLFGKGEDMNTMGQLAERMLKAFQGNSLARPTGTIIAVEEELRGPLIPGLPELLARVDLVVDQGDALMMTDFKTARSSWSEDHVEDSASQLLLYHELAKDLSDGRPVKLGFAVLTKTKLPEMTLYPVQVNRHRLERTKKIVERVWHAVESGHFLPSPSPLNCSNCPFREQCAAWKG